MRSILQIHVDDREGLDDALSVQADALSIAWTEQKDGSGTAAALADDLGRVRLTAHPPLLFVRLPAIDMAGIDDVLAAVMRGEPDGIVLGACRGARDVQHLGVKLAVHEAEGGLDEGATSIVAEAGSTARDLFTLGSYADASPRLLALVWNGQDLADELGLDPSAQSSGAPLWTARNMMLFAARSAGVALVDGPSGSPDEDLAALCRQRRADGFNAKLATSAAQVAIINATFDRDAERL